MISLLIQALLSGSLDFDPLELFLIQLFIFIAWPCRISARYIDDLTLSWIVIITHCTHPLTPILENTGVARVKTQLKKSSHSTKFKVNSTSTSVT
jgi:hypothetical protein